MNFLERRDRALTRLAWLFLLLTTLYVAGHVAISL